MAATVIGAAALLAPALALAEAPADSQSTTKAFDSPADMNKQIQCAGSVAESTIVVPAGEVGTYLSDVDVTTGIDHTHSGDLKIELIAPGGRTVSLAEANENRHAAQAFAGTVWDDSSPFPVATFQQPSSDPLPQGSLAPQGTFGSLVGINPTGTWTLRVTDTVDDCSQPAPVNGFDGGALNRWSLSLTTRAAAPPTTPPATYATPDTAAPVPVTSAAPAVMKLNVTGATGRIWDVNALTKITHDNPSELHIELSHGGRTVVLADDTTGDYFFYNDRIFDDSAPNLLRANQAPGAVRPISGLSAFRGMDPNGEWTLTVVDKFPGAFCGPAEGPKVACDGSLAGFGVSLQNADLSGATVVVSAPATPIVGRPPAQPAPQQGSSSTSQVTTPGGGPSQVVITSTKPNLRVRGNVVWRGSKVRGNIKLTGTSPVAQLITVTFRNTRTPKKVAATTRVRVKAGKVNLNVPVGKRLKPGRYTVQVMAGKTPVSRANVSAIRR